MAVLLAFGQGPVQGQAAPDVTVGATVGWNAS